MARIEQTMTKEEYWFLDLVIRYWWPLYGLDAADIESEANKPSHNLSHAEVVDVLHHLFLSGDLTAYRLEKFGAEPSPHFVPTPSEIELGLVGEDNIFFGLTAQGGTRWEAASKPNWGIFIHNFSRGQNYAIISADRGIVQQWLETEIQPIVSSEWSILTPWQATYWKPLPTGHQLSYKRKNSSGKSQRRHHLREIQQKEELREKLEANLDKWYTNPWWDKEWFG